MRMMRMKGWPHSCFRVKIRDELVLTPALNSGAYITSFKENYCFFFPHSPANLVYHDHFKTSADLLSVAEPRGTQAGVEAGERARTHARAHGRARGQSVVNS